MTDRTAFLRGILAAPAGDAPRLVYADWLDEQGEWERAAFIRWSVAGGPPGGLPVALDVACPEAFRPELDRCFVSIDQYSYRPGDSTYLELTYRHGFLEEIGVTAQMWLAVGDSLSWSPEQTEPRPLTYEERESYACKVCCNVPDETGMIEHGRGCYTQDEDGGGSSWVELRPGPLVPRPCPATAQPVTTVRLTTDFGVNCTSQPGRSQRWSFQNDPTEWQSEPVSLTFILLPTRRDQVNAVLEQVCRLRWPAVETWTLPPEPRAGLLAPPMEAEGEWTQEDVDRVMNGTGVNQPLGVMDVDDPASHPSSAPPDNARRRPGHSRMPTWLSERRSRPSRR